MRAGEGDSIWHKRTVAAEGRAVTELGARQLLGHRELF